MEEEEKEEEAEEDEEEDEFDVDTELQGLGLIPRPPSAEPKVKTGRLARRRAAKDAETAEFRARFEDAVVRGVISEERSSKGQSALASGGSFKLMPAEEAALDDHIEQERMVAQQKEARLASRAAVLSKSKDSKQGMGRSRRKMIDDSENYVDSNDRQMDINSWAESN